METKPIYLTGEALGIEQWERDGLIALVGPLSRDELDVNMRNPNHTCGTACCIGGHLCERAGRLFSREKLWWGPARPLYYPAGGWDATAPQAARAITNFLVTGHPQWDRVMSEPSA